AQRIRLATQDIDQARDYIEQAMELISEDDYENFWLYTAMSTIDRADGMADDAVQHAQKALDIVKDSLSGYDRAYAHLTLAKALLSAGKDGEAIEHFKAAYKLSSLSKLLHAEVLESMIPVSTDGKACMRYEQELHTLITENEYTWISTDSDQGSSANNSEHQSKIYIQTLGQFAISCNNVAINIKRSASIRLLLLLIVNQGRWINKDYIIDQLFPDSTASSGINNFNVALSVLRKALDAAISSQAKDSSCILREKDRYQLDLDLVSLDLRDFEQQYMNLKKSGSEDFIKWLDLYGLYCGEFLPEFPYESFLEMDRERFSYYRKDTLLTIARLYAGQDDIENAWLYYDQAMTADPYDEDQYYETLEVLLDHDAVSLARVTEKRMRKYLEDELGIPCSNQIQSMFDYYHKQKSSSK
ncbi:MAG: hypothetical protein HUJ72_03585, partial [Blautia sp.]|nr:hypothetical protein [Blautia sp.]